MTKVQTRFKLARPLGEPDFDHVKHVHSVYGILAVRVLPPGQDSGGDLFVEYDASRLTLVEVRGILGSAGIPIT